MSAWDLLRQAWDYACVAATQASGAWATVSGPRVFTRGQWVYVWRRAPNRGRKQNVLQRDRWVGPGIVALQNGGTVWVGMRSRLWKCSEPHGWRATRKNRQCIAHRA